MQFNRALKQSFRVEPSLGLASPRVHLRPTLHLARFQSSFPSRPAPVEMGIELSPSTTPTKEPSEEPTPIDKTSTNQPLTSNSSALLPSSSSTPPSLPEMTKTSRDHRLEEGIGGESKQTIAERDAEMMQKLLDRDGGQSTLSTEDGAWTGLKTHVKNNMFRVI